MNRTWQKATKGGSPGGFALPRSIRTGEVGRGVPPSRRRDRTAYLRVVAALLLAVLSCAAAGDWPTYHGGPGLDGYTDTRLGDRLVPLWSYRAGAAVLLTPVAADGVVVAITDKSEVLALSRSGELIWSKWMAPAPSATNGVAGRRFDIEAPPTIVKDAVVVGSRQGLLMVLDLKTGGERWRYDVDSPIKGAASWSVLADGRTAVLAMGQDDGVVHAVDLQSGQRVWQTDAAQRCDGALSSGAGVMVFGSCAAALNIASATDGARRHLVELGGGNEVAGGVAIAGGQVFSGSRGGFLFCAGLQRGEIVWVNKDAAAEVFSTPAVSAESIVYSCADGNIYCVGRKDGKRLWMHATGAFSVTSPVIAADRVLVGADGTLLMLALDSGRKVWSHALSDDCSGPAVFEKMVIVGADDGMIWAFRNATRDEAVHE